MDDNLPEMRIGDRERREVDTRLQQAHADGQLTLIEYDERSKQCWAARTRSELDALTRDLPAPEPQATAVAPIPEPAPAPAPDRKAWHNRMFGGLAAVVFAGAAIWGGSQVLFAGDAKSIFGSGTVPVAPSQNSVDVGMLFGSMKVVVPDDALVRRSGTVVFGSVNCQDACDGTGTREIAVDASGAFGSVQIITQSEAARGGIDDGDRGRDRNDNNNDDDD